MAWYDFMRRLFYKKPPSEKNEVLEELLEVLKSMTEGLLFLSESDAPLEVLSWEKQTEAFDLESLMTHLEIAPDTAIQPYEVEELFRSMTKIRPYFSPEEVENANRFKALVSFFETQVSNAIAFKVGEIERTVYVLGTVADTHILGLKTLSVET